MKISITCCLSLIGAMVSIGQIDRARLEKLDVRIQEVMRDEDISGAAVAVLQGTNIVFARGYGDGITPQTPFKVGSISKSFVAVAIMQLEEQGKLDLDSPVRRYLPWFRTIDESESDKITVRHLLHHRSGISGSRSRILGGVETDRSYDRELANLVMACPKMRVVTPPGPAVRLREYWIRLFGRYCHDCLWHPPP